MQAAVFDKCKAGKPANPDICSAQIHMHDFDKSMRVVVYWWCIGSAIPINDFLDHHYQKYDAG